MNIKVGMFFRSNGSEYIHGTVRVEKIDRDKVTLEWVRVSSELRQGLIGYKSVIPKYHLENYFIPVKSSNYGKRNTNVRRTK